MDTVERIDVQIANIIQREDLQPRIELDKQTVDEYKKLYEQYGPRAMDPVRVCSIGDSGELLLTRGFTRCAAAQAAGLDEIYCERIQLDSEEDLIRDSLGGNRHGLKLSSADKRRAVELYHRQIPRGTWESTRQVAQLIGCSHELVAAYRREMSDSDSREPAEHPLKAYLTEKLQEMVSEKPVNCYELCYALQKLVPDDMDDYELIDGVTEAFTEQPPAGFIKANGQMMTTAYHNEQLPAMISKAFKKQATENEASAFVDLCENYNTTIERLTEIAAADKNLEIVEVTYYDYTDEPEFGSEAWEDWEPIEAKGPGISLRADLLKENKEKQEREWEEKYGRKHSADDWERDRRDYINKKIHDHLDTTHGIELEWEQLAVIVLGVGLAAWEDDGGEPVPIKQRFNDEVLKSLQEELDCSWRTFEEDLDMDQVCDWIGLDYKKITAEAAEQFPEPNDETAEAKEAS